MAFILGVDLDGVCGDHTAAFRAVVAAERGAPESSLGPQHRWDFADWGVTADEFYDLHRRGVLEHRMFRTMPVVPGCAEALWRLSDAGAWIRLITHRLYANWGHAVAVADTVTWLDEAGVPYRDLCFLGNKPQVEADLYVDDAPHNVEELRRAGNRVIVFDQPYNAHVEGPRASTWTEVEGLVAEAMAADGHPVQTPLPGLSPEARARLEARRAPGRGHEVGS
jgi:5'(3')-deoxyribonucleotidase